MKVKILIILFIFLVQNSVQAQQKNYSGEFRLSESEVGTARYSYVEGDSSEKIKTGPFSYSFEKYSSNSNSIKRSIQGQYVNDLKDGRWIYETNKYDVNIESINERFQIRASVDGQLTKAEVGYQRGKAQGDWKIETQELKNGRLQGQKELLTAKFSNGRMVDQFLYRNQNGTEISGSFNTSHFFNGLWKLKYRRDSVNYEEERIYDDGFLVELKLKNIDDDLILYDLSYRRVKEKLGNVRRGVGDISYKIGDEFFGVLFDDGFPVFSEEELSQTYGNQFITDAMNIFVEEEFLSEINLVGLLAVDPGATRRFEYTFSEKENIALQESSQLLSQYISDIEKFINNTTLTLNRQRSDSLAYSYRLLDSTLNKLKILEVNTNRLLGSEFKYQSRNTYFKEGIEGINRFDTVRYSYNNEERVRVFDNKVSVTNGEGIILNIRNYIQAKADLIDRLDPFMKESIIEIEKDLVSQQLEEDIVKYLAQVDEIYQIQRGLNVLDDDSIPLTNLHLELYANYQRKLERRMQTYSEAEGFEEKQKAGLEIIGLSQTFIDVYEPAGKLREMTKKLDEAYTRYSYNPYMDRHDIKTRIKRNIYFAAIDILIPSFRKDLVETQDYNEIPSIIKEMEETFERLFEIAKLDDSETRSLERRLRRENNPNRIKRLLDI